MKKLFCAAFSALFLFVAFAPCSLRAAEEGAKNLAGKFNVAAAAEITAGTGEKAETVWSTADVDVSRVDTEKKLIAFTFDDAPNYTLKRTLEVFENFNEKNPDCPASATIFVNGILVNQKTYSYLERAHGAGFELGNHTQSHKNLKLLSPEKIREEIDSVDLLLRKLDGKARHLLRVPYGNFNEKVIAQAKAPMIDWSIDPEDWKKGVSTRQIYENIWKNKAPGAIVLMHDAYPHTAEAVQMLLPKLREAGYQVVNVSQLSKALGQPLLTGKVYTHFKQG